MRIFCGWDMSPPMFFSFCDIACLVIHVSDFLYQNACLSQNIQAVEMPNWSMQETTWQAHDRQNLQTCFSLTDDITYRICAHLLLSRRWTQMSSGESINREKASKTKWGVCWRDERAGNSVPRHPESTKRPEASPTRRSSKGRIFPWVPGKRWCDGATASKELARRISLPRKDFVDQSWLSPALVLAVLTCIIVQSVPCVIMIASRDSSQDFVRTCSFCHCNDKDRHMQELLVRDVLQRDIYNTRQNANLIDKVNYLECQWTVNKFFVCKICATLCKRWGSYYRSL